MTLPVATAMPLLLVPVDSDSGATANAIEAAVLVAGTLPLALQFASALAMIRRTVR